MQQNILYFKIHESSYTVPLRLKNQELWLWASPSPTAVTVPSIERHDKLKLWLKPGMSGT